MKGYKLKGKEDERFKEMLERFEIETLNETGVGKISGGFARAEFDGMDKDVMLITLKWGVQSDCDDRVNTERYTYPLAQLQAKGWDIDTATRILREDN